jgi:translation initiation factor 3 subunit L
MKKTDQMYALLAMCVSLCPTRLDDTVQTALRDKQGEHLLKMQQGIEGLPSFQELFLFACPKFISLKAPDYQAVTEEAVAEEEEEDGATTYD